MPYRAVNREHTCIGSYDILEKIAEGGMGSVYKGRHRRTHDIVAIKIVPPALVSNPVLYRRFEQEFRVAHSLDHPHIVRGIEFGHDGETPYLVMEYVDGENLADRIERQRRLPANEAIRIIGQVAQGLHQAHKQGIIHRDIKPDNILLTSEGKAKLTDLGLVKNVDRDLNLTHTGRGLGTPHFMSPEQFRDAKSADVRSDIYSLAATLYVMVTGQMPFEATNPVDAWMKKIHNDYKAPKVLVSDLSDRMDRAIRRAMSGEPSLRQGSCPEFMEDLIGECPWRNGAAANIVRAKPAFGAAAANLLTSERRGVIRFASTLGGICHPIGGDHDIRWSAKISDVSATGVGLVLRRRFEPQTVLSVEPRLADQDSTHPLLVRVVRVVPQARRQWVVGCTFARELSEDEVQSLL